MDNGYRVWLLPDFRYCDSGRSYWDLCDVTEKKVADKKRCVMRMNDLFLFGYIDCFKISRKEKRSIEMSI